MQARIDPASLDRTAEKARQKLLGWGDKSGKSWSDAFGRTAKADPHAPRDSAKFAAAGRRDAKAYNDGFRSGTRGKDGITQHVEKLSQGVGQLTSAAGSFAMAGLPAALVGVAGAAATAVGAIGLLPAALDGAIAGVGTLVIGLHGFDKALKDMGDPKKFAKDLQTLSPAAQQAALEIKHLVDGPLGQLKKATQESLFKGMSSELDQLSTKFTPTLQKLTTGIASSFNAMTHNIGEQLMTPGTSGALTGLMSNIVSGFQELAPAVAPFTDAMVKIGEVGSQWWPKFAQEISNAAREFDQFVQKASASGQIQKWIQDGIDAAKELGRIVADVGRIFWDLAPIGREILPPIEHGLSAIADILRDHPGLIYAVVGAFAAWKTIEGIASVISALTVIKTALVGLPAVAQTAAGGISAALASVAVPAWLTFLMKGAAGVGTAVALWNTHGDSAPGGDQTTTKVLQNEGATPAQITQYQQMVQRGDTAGANNLEQQLRKHGAGPVAGQDTRTPQQIHDQISQRQQGLPGGPPLAPNAPGWDEFLPKPDTSFPVPGVPASGGAGKKPELPVLPDSGRDPTSLLAGYNVTSGLYSAASRVIQEQDKVAQEQSDLNTLLKSNNATADEITRKRNELAEAERTEHESEMRLNEAKQQATNKLTKGMGDAHGELSKLGAGLDKDLGISKGLAGLADNLVRFIGALATAPLKAMLAPIAERSNGASGMFGMAAANGAFGPDIAGRQNQQSQQDGYAGSDMQAGPTSQPSYAPVSAGKAGTAQQIYSSFLANGYSPESARAVVEAATLESGLNPTITNASGHNSLFQTSSDKGVPSTVPGQVNWALGEAGRQGGPAAMNASNPQNWWASNVERGGYPGSNYNQFGPQTDALLAPMTGGGGGRFPQGMPNTAALSSPTGPQQPSTPQSNFLTNGMPEAKPGWQPQGGGNLGVGGGLIGAGIQGAASAFGGPMGGAAASTAMSLINSGIAYGGKVAGIAASGLMSTFTPSDPDSGQSPIANSWLQRVAGGLSGAAPAIGKGGAGDADKQAEKKQQGNVHNGDVHNGNIVNAPITVQQSDGQSGKSTAVDIQNQLAMQSAEARFSSRPGS